MRAIGIAAALLLLSAGLSQGQIAQERVDLDVVQRIREEGLNRSQIEQLAGHLTDVIGPRLTGSPQMKQANEWTAQQLREWGLTNVVVEPWGEFGRGWEVVHAHARLLAPFVMPLAVYPLAWSGSTRGAVSGPVLIVEAADAAELRRKYAGRLKGAFVLTSEPIELEPEYTLRPRRLAADSLFAPAPAPPAARAGGRPQASPEMQQRFALAAALDSLMRVEGAVSLRPSPWQYSILRVGGLAGSARDAKAPIPGPALMLAQEQYNQLYRNVQRGVPVRLEANVQTRFHTDDLQAYNTLGDLPGSDLRDQYVMIGAHLDSWHAGTGATDNASGSAVMMEAMRILKAVGVQPRRTIRIGLWSAEEQGLLGSRYWVEKHPELHDRISVYLNFDNGTGRIRGVWNQSNAAVTPIFEQVLFPFRDLGVLAVRHGNTGSTDHMSFDRVGIPGFNFIQDPIEYSIRTHHSNVDTYDQLVIEDLQQAAVVVAATAYQLAMRDEMMPRKPQAASN